MAANIDSENPVLQVFSQALIGKIIYLEDVGSISFRLCMYWEDALIILDSSQM